MLVKVSTDIYMSRTRGVSVVGVRVGVNRETESGRRKGQSNVSAGTDTERLGEGRDILYACLPSGATGLTESLSTQCWDLLGNFDCRC